MPDEMRTGVLHESLLPPYKRGNGTGVNVPVVAIDDVVRWLRGLADERGKKSEGAEIQGDARMMLVLASTLLDAVADHLESLKGANDA